MLKRLRPTQDERGRTKRPRNISSELLKIRKKFKHDMNRLPVLFTVMHLDGEDCLQQLKILNLN